MYHIPFLTPPGEPRGEVADVNEKMTVSGLVRVASIMTTIAKKPCHVGGAYRFP